MYQRLSPCKILAGFQGNHDITPASPTAMRGQAEQLLGFSQWTPFGWLASAVVGPSAEGRRRASGTTAVRHGRATGLSFKDPGRAAIASVRLPNWTCR